MKILFVTVALVAIIGTVHARPQTQEGGSGPPNGGDRSGPGGGRGPPGSSDKGPPKGGPPGGGGRGPPNGRDRGPPDGGPPDGNGQMLNVDGGPTGNEYETQDREAGQSDSKDSLQGGSNSKGTNNPQKANNQESGADNISK